MSSRIAWFLSASIRFPFRFADQILRALRPSQVVVGVSLAGYHKNLGGVGNYAISLLRTWPTIFPLRALRLFCSKGTFTLAQKLLPFRSRIEHRFLVAESDLPAAAADCDVIFFPCGHLDPIPPPQGLAFHLADLQEWFFPEFFSNEELCRRRNRYRTLHAFGAALLVPSEFTRRCVIELLNYPAERVFTVPLLCGDLPDRGTRPPGVTFDAFVFYPADDFPHKNHLRLLDALRIIADEGINIPLVCTGSRPSGTDWEALATEHRLDFIHLGRIPREEVRWLFDNARALVFPSQFEGFGIPVLEALKCGLPIACAKFSSLPEVAGAVAEYCDPFDVEDIARAVRVVWQDEDKRRQLREGSAARAAMFSATNIVPLHARIFDQIKLAGPPNVDQAYALPLADPERAWHVCANRPRPDTSDSHQAPDLVLGPIPTLPIHFFTLVLNGMPFLRRQWDVLQSLPGPVHWHVVEGLAELKHDTAWGLKNGGVVPSEFHADGRSNDGSSEFLDQIAMEFPDRVTLYRRDRPWDGKLEMCQAPLVNVGSEALLWQLDADEFWAPETIAEVRATFEKTPDLMAAQFQCRFYVAPHLILDNIGFYGNDPRVEWRRVWRFLPGDQWRSHEPPVLERGGADLFSLRALDSHQTSTNGWTFRHFAYVTSAQVAFKESYYGYRGALAGWQSMQESRNPELMPSQFLPWIPPGIWAVRCHPSEVFTN